MSWLEVTRDNSDWVVENYTIEQVKDFEYLEANINQHNSMYNEIKLRIFVANNDYNAMNN